MLKLRNFLCRQGLTVSKSENNILKNLQSVTQENIFFSLMMSYLASGLIRYSANYPLNALHPNFQFHFRFDCQTSKSDDFLIFNEKFINIRKV